MNNILVKILCGLFLITTITSDGYAGSADTTILLANNTAITPAIVTIEKVANIVYPVSFETDKQQFIDYVQRFSNKKRNYLVEMYDKGQNYFPKITPILKKYNLPEELKVLIALESGFNGNAVSRSGAVGYWQMMNESAKDYGLKTNTAKKDERRDLIKSTKAASKYLVAHAKMLGDNLLLMVASYNCGIGKIKQAIKRSGITNADFWDIKKYLPKETRNYVMDFIALNIIFANYDKFSKKNLVFNSQLIEVPISENPGKLNTSITN